MTMSPMRAQRRSLRPTPRPVEPAGVLAQANAASSARDSPAQSREREVMPGTPRLERLTASDLFLLMWDDYGWSSDIGALAILEGSGLLESDGRVRIEVVSPRGCGTGFAGDEYRAPGVVEQLLAGRADKQPGGPPVAPATDDRPLRV